ncbi:putative MFS multidrug transporter [Zopfochytrium polystomum]|nr:putative MFS multidrug transporter [Zopfochytrium polystomum]
MHSESGNTAGDDNESATAFGEADKEPQAVTLTIEDSQPSKGVVDANVDWDGPNDPENPKNWPKARRWLITMVAALFTLMGPLGSSIIAPAVPAVARDLDLTTDVQREMIISIFVLAFAFGPLFFGPVSELYGRRWVIILPSFVCLAFNIACAFSQSLAELLIFRFVSAFAGSAALAIGAGVLTDMFGPAEVGPAINVFSLAPAMGPVLGPVIGSARGIRVVAMETYAPVLLAAKAARLGKPSSAITSSSNQAHVSITHRLAESAKRPFILLFTQPIVITVSLYLAYVYGLIYLVIATFSKLWIVRYHESLSISGLNFLALGIGLAAGSIGFSSVLQRIYFVMRDRNGGVTVPEHRLPAAIPVAFLLPASIFMYGWSAQERVHWLVPDIGIMLFGFAFAVPFQTLNIYLVDAYRRYSASAFAASSFLRSVFGFAFPLFANAMYDKLDYGWGNSVLGFVAVAGIPAPWLLYRYGAYLRSKSTYAAG